MRRITRKYAESWQLSSIKAGTLFECLLSDSLHKIASCGSQIAFLFLFNLAFVISSIQHLLECSTLLCPSYTSQGHELRLKQPMMCLMHPKDTSRQRNLRGFRIMTGRVHVRSYFCLPWLTRLPVVNHALSGEGIARARAFALSSVIRPACGFLFRRDSTISASTQLDGKPLSTYHEHLYTTNSIFCIHEHQAALSQFG
jgi:hypothetical protein